MQIFAFLTNFAFLPLKSSFSNRFCRSRCLWTRIPNYNINGLNYACPKCHRSYFSRHCAKICKISISQKLLCRFLQSWAWYIQNKNSTLVSYHHFFPKFSRLQVTNECANFFAQPYISLTNVSIFAISVSKHVASKNKCGCLLSSSAQNEQFLRDIQKTALLHAISTGRGLARELQNLALQYSFWMYLKNCSWTNEAILTNAVSL